MIPIFCGHDSPRRVLTLKCDRLTFEVKPTLSFDFTGGACATNNNHIVLCFSKQDKKRCYKSRSPIPEHWWQFSLTRESIFEHNFTAIALSSYNISGKFLATSQVFKNDLVAENNYLFAMGSLKHAKTELLDFSDWKWKKSLPYLNYTEIYSFAVSFYRYEFYVVGGKTKNKVLSEVATFNPITEKWSRVGNLKFPRFDHTIDIIGDKLYIIGGSENFEHCDLLNGFGCSVLNDMTMEQEDVSVLYGFYPSKCELGTSNITI